MTDTSEQIKKIKKLISTCTNPKQKKTYQDLLVKLTEKLKSETPKPAEPQVVAVKPQGKTEQKTEQKTEIKPQAPVAQKPSKPPSESKRKEEEKVLSKDEEKAQGKEQEKAQGNDVEKEEGEKGPKPFFQGIGIIKGEVTVTEEKSTIKLDGKEYRLYYVPGRRLKAYQALKREIELTGNSTQRLIVYPKVLHLPKRDQNHVVAFQLVGFISSKSQPTALNQELRDGEFKLSGLWQFIPVCRTPCISVFRNFDKERLAWIKKTEATRTVKFMKASHIPLLWRDSPVKPFRFNPKADKEEQGKPKFVQVKVKFIPSRDVFGFVEELAESRDKAPGFLKASKKLKAEAMAAAKQQKQETSGQSKAPKEKKKNQSETSEVIKEKKQETSEQLEAPKEEKKNQSGQLEDVIEQKLDTSESSEAVNQEKESQSERSEAPKQQKENQSETSEDVIEQKQEISELSEDVIEQKQETSDTSEVVKVKEESQSSQSGIVKEKEESQLETSEVVKEKEEGQSEPSEAPKEQKKNQSGQLEDVIEQKQETSETSEVVNQEKESQLESPKAPKKKPAKKKTRSS